MSKSKVTTIQYTEQEDLRKQPIPTNQEVQVQEQPYLAYPMRYIPWDPEMACLIGKSNLYIYSGSSRNSSRIDSYIKDQVTTVNPDYCTSSASFSDINTSLPSWDHGYVLAPLREGYIMLRRLYEEETEADWFEYRVQPDGSLRNIMWTSEEIGADVRYRNESTIYSLSFSRRAEYHILYSDVQISWQTYQDLEGDESFRNKMMQKIQPSDMAHCNMIYSLSSQRLVHNADIYDEESPDGYLNRLDGSKYVVGIVDVLGTADYLQGAYEEKMNQMNELLESLRTTQNPAHLRMKRLNSERYYREILSSNPLPTQTTLDQYKALQSITSTLNLIGWANEDNTKHIGNNLDRNRMNSILGKNERAEIRDQIKNFKKIYVEYLKSDVYQDRLLFHLNNTPFRILEGKTKASLHLTGISESYESVDFFLRERDEMENIDQTYDIGYKFVKEIMDDRSKSMNISKLFHEQISIDIEANPLDLGAMPSAADNHISTIDIAVNFGLTLDSILGATQNIVRQAPAYLPVSIQMLNRNYVTGIDTPFFESTTLNDVIMGKRSPVITPSHPKGIYRLVEISDDVRNADFIAYPNGEIADVRQVDYSTELQQLTHLDGSLKAKALWLIDKIVETTTYKSFVAGLSYLNVVLAGRDLLDIEGETIDKIWRDRIAFVNALAGAWAATWDLSRIIRLKAGIIATEQSFKISAYITKINAGTAFVSTAIYGYDCYINFTEGDNDAGLWYTGAALCSVVLGILLLSSGPVGWVILLAVLATGCGILGAVFEDSPIEQFAKNFLLRNKRIDPPTATNPWISIYEHYRNRDALINDRFKDWENFEAAKNKMIEILYGLRLEFDRTNELYKQSLTFHSLLLKEVKVNSYASVFQAGYSELTHYEMYFFPNGIENRTYTRVYPALYNDQGEIVVTPSGAIYDRDVLSHYPDSTPLFYNLNDDPVKITCSFNLRALENEMNTKSQILFICRYQINPQIEIPGSLGGTQRYIGYLEKCYSEISYFAGPPSPTMAGTLSAAYIRYDSQAFSPERLYGSTMRTGTKSELFSIELWEKN
ncbi:MAG: hypothetical protein JW801_12630 [Bacteroidales bacterium]|nr:hypothetical protein [Bacteroidales bacterium]MBN2862641.1 hypothetical protein [Bacteroidales bacterium]